MFSLALLSHAFSFRRTTDNSLDVLVLLIKVPKVTECKNYETETLRNVSVENPYFSGGGGRGGT